MGVETVHPRISNDDNARHYDAVLIATFLDVVLFLVSLLIAVLCLLLFVSFHHVTSLRPAPHATIYSNLVSEPFICKIEHNEEVLWMFSRQS